MEIINISFGSPKRIKLSYSFDDFDYLGVDGRGAVIENYYQNGQYFTTFGFAGQTEFSPTLTISGMDIFVNKTSCKYTALVNYKNYTFGLVLLDKGKCSADFLNNFDYLITLFVSRLMI